MKIAGLLIALTTVFIGALALIGERLRGKPFPKPIEELILAAKAPGLVLFD